MSPQNWLKRRMGLSLFSGRTRRNGVYDPGYFLSGISLVTIIHSLNFSYFGEMAFLGIKPDKWKHLVVGIVLGSAAQAFFSIALQWNPWLSGLVSVLLVTAIAYGFELFSLITGKGHYELWDAVFSIIGGIAGSGLVFLLSP